MAAAGSAGAIFFNQGQVCTAGSRLYVQRKRFDQVLERLAAIAGDLSIGPGLIRPRRSTRWSRPGSRSGCWG